MWYALDFDHPTVWKLSILPPRVGIHPSHEEVRVLISELVSCALVISSSSDVVTNLKHGDRTFDGDCIGRSNLLHVDDWIEDMSRGVLKLDLSECCCCMHYIPCP